MELPLSSQLSSRAFLRTCNVDPHAKAFILQREAGAGGPSNGIATFRRLSDILLVLKVAVDGGNSGELPFMRVSFDLDETLISSRWAGDSECGILPKFLLRRLAEPLRPGARRLFAELESRGHQVWIYTSSSRSALRIHRWLFLHGLRVEGVVNDDRHRKAISGQNFIGRAPTKFPPAFDIDLHVDDSPGVAVEGGRYGFEVQVIAADDAEWTDAVLQRVDSLANRMKRSA